MWLFRIGFSLHDMSSGMQILPPLHRSITHSPFKEFQFKSSSQGILVQYGFMRQKEKPNKVRIIFKNLPPNGSSNSHNKSIHINLHSRVLIIHVTWITIPMQTFINQQNKPKYRSGNSLTQGKNNLLWPSCSTKAAPWWQHETTRRGKTLFSFNYIYYTIQSNKPQCSSKFTQPL